MLYQDLTIENFRGISKIEISDLKRVNLLAGRNNSGKSSILEAFFLLTGMSNPRLTLNINFFRDLHMDNNADFAFLFKDLDTGIPVNISSKSGRNQRKLTIRPLDENSLESSNRKGSSGDSSTKLMTSATGTSISMIEGIESKYQRGSKHPSISTVTWKDGEIFLKTDRSYQENIKGIYLNYNSMMADIGTRIERLLIEKRMDGVIAVLQQVEPALIDIRLGTGGMIWVDTGKPRLLPVNIMGDGIRRSLAILAAVADTGGGLVLIDEIENGLHYTSLDVLWKALFTACRMYDVQLVATTHSYECIESFTRTYQAAEPAGDDIRLYRIDRSDEIHRAYAYSAPMLAAGIEKDFEVR